MDVSSLTRDLGELSGRLPKSPSGWRFVLGSTAEWQLEPLVAGDYTELSQEFDGFGYCGLVVHVRLKHPPLSLTGGRIWGVQLLATNSYSSPIRLGFPGRERQFDMFVALASPASHQITKATVRLVLT